MSGVGLVFLGVEVIRVGEYGVGSGVEGIRDGVYLFCLFLFL